MYAILVDPEKLRAALDWLKAHKVDHRRWTEQSEIHERVVEQSPWIADVPGVDDATANRITDAFHDRSAEELDSCPTLVTIEDKEKAVLFKLALAGM
jgi:hypothetical protein